jgi:hypothetical protein
MRRRFVAFIGALVVAVALFGLTTIPVAGQASAALGTTRTAAAEGTLTTPWGTPDLQGTWTQPERVPMQRAARYKGREFLTAEEIATRDAKRAVMQRRSYREKVGTYIDVAAAYGAEFLTVFPTGRRTGMIVDPSDGRMPPFTPEALKRRREIGLFVRALLQATPACKEPTHPHCTGGKYGPIAPEYSQRMPHYNMSGVGFHNRHEHMEEQAMGWRCLTSNLPVTGGYRQIIQSPQSISVSIDVGQGQSFQRVVNITDRPHLSSKVRQWWGDSRARWEGKTLVIDTTNFNDKVDYQSARQDLHLIERYTLRDADTLEYRVTLDDPTTWTKPWTFVQELKRQPDSANRFYPEPRCHEGKVVGSNDLTAARADEKLFKEGKGPNPATLDKATMGADNDESEFTTRGSQNILPPEDLVNQYETAPYHEPLFER